MNINNRGKNSEARPNPPNNMGYSTFEKHHKSLSRSMIDENQYSNSQKYENLRNSSNEANSFSYHNNEMAHTDEESIRGNRSLNSIKGPIFQK